MPPIFAQVFITTTSVVLCFVGLFGNISLLLATATQKKLHHKICYIVAVIASLHLVCLLCELYIEAQQLRFHTVTRSECFRHTFVYVFALIAQSTMFLMMALDFLLAVTIPLR
ncbi:unnamed protein product [Heligmosomoides polygyrus]|uniref:G_PROTEIN_RECEP_F1_2 domain-containing protein n=1 Tax=Heligmosomoides polygyrus TaxID=6339 RepID=A0A183G0H7_HELPZ|nr:unnamed protein product [Heligmosomoides polygyrus]